MGKIVIVVGAFWIGIICAGCGERGSWVSIWCGSSTRVCILVITSRGAGGCGGGALGLAYCAAEYVF